MFAFEQAVGLFSKKNLTEEFVETARTKFGLRVHAWTINEREKMEEVRASGRFRPDVQI